METFTFAGFEFPRNIPMLFPNRKNYTKKMVNGSYRHSPKPLTRDTQETAFYLNEKDAMKGDFQPGLRWEWCDQVEDVSINHTGWYLDEYQDNSYRGMVFRLPKARGFIVGYSMGDGMISFIEYDTVYDEENRAAHAADESARIAAEKERDYREEEEARVKAEEDAAQALVDMQDAVNESVDKAGWMQESANG